MLKIQLTRMNLAGTAAHDRGLHRVHNHQNWRKRLDDAAFGDGAVAALADDTVELTAQGGEISNLAFDFREVLASNYIHGFA